MSDICYIIAEQDWEAWGLFWKRSVSLYFLGVLLGWLLGCLCCGCFVFSVFWWHLDHCLTFSLLQGNRQSDKMYWWPSELRARTAQAKKNNMLFRLYTSMLVQFWTRCEAVMWRIQTAWQRDCWLASRRHSSCLAEVSACEWPSLISYSFVVKVRFATFLLGLGKALANVFAGFENSSQTWFQWICWRGLMGLV